MTEYTAVTINDTEYSCRTMKIVCPTCQGEGKYCNPAIGAMTAREFGEWEPEEREDYLSGHYDVCCEECNGLRVVDVPDIDYLGDTLADLYRREQKELEDDRRADAAMYRAEMGYGYC